MEVERETPFEESAGGRLLAYLHFPRCVQLYVTCSTPTETRTLSFCGSLVERPLLATLTTVNCTVQQRSGPCGENSCADQLCTGLAISSALIRPHVHTVQMLLLYCTLFNLWVTDGVWQNPYAKRTFPILIWYLITYVIFFMHISTYSEHYRFFPELPIL